MILTDDELRELYVGLVKPFQHPDPLGFMTRALLLSEGDPDFVDGKDRGFMPLNGTYIIDTTGVPETQSLENNITGALAIDRLNFDQYKDVDLMVIASHEEGVFDPNNLTSEQNTFLSEIQDSREDVLRILEPPLATIDDVVKLLTATRDNVNIPANQLDFFDYLLTNKV